MSALNIKDPEAHRLAREIAAATGDSLTGAVRTALREKAEALARARRPDPAEVEALLDFGRRFRAELAAGGLRVEDLPGDDDLYDARGLPR